MLFYEEASGHCIHIAFLVDIFPEVGLATEELTS